MELFVVAFLLGLVCAGGCNIDDLRRIDSIQLEPECSSEGGTCVVAADCPAGSLTLRTGLCPKQQRLGIECCHGISERETRCRRRGGECFPECPKSFRDPRAKDCAPNSICCILV